MSEPLAQNIKPEQIKRRIYRRYSNFLRVYNGIAEHFTLTQRYVDRGGCYADDAKISWAIYYHGIIPICILAEKREKYKGATWVSVYEIRDELRGKGIGSLILKSYMKSNPSIIGQVKGEEASFYKRLGFKRVEDENFKYTYGYNFHPRS